MLLPGRPTRGCRRLQSMRSRGGYRYLLTADVFQHDTIAVPGVRLFFSLLVSRPTTRVLWGASARAQILRVFILASGGRGRICGTSAELEGPDPLKPSREL